MDPFIQKQTAIQAVFNRSLSPIYHEKKVELPKDIPLTLYEQFKENIGEYSPDKTLIYNDKLTDDQEIGDIYNQIETIADSVRTSPTILTDAEITQLQTDITATRADLAAHADFASNASLQDADALLSIASDQFQDIKTIPASIDDNQENFANIKTTLESASGLLDTRIQDVQNKIKASTLHPPPSPFPEYLERKTSKIGKTILEENFAGQAVQLHLSKQRFLNVKEDTKIENAASAFSPIYKQPIENPVANKLASFKKAYHFAYQRGQIIDRAR